MLELLRDQIKDYPGNEEKFNHLREFLQVLTLKIIYDLGYFKHISFVGGTALRILYDLRRFSEDLDFCLTAGAGYDFDVFAQNLQRQLHQFAVDVELKSRDINTVQSIEIKFTNLLFELGLSPLRDEKLMIKVEIDTNPAQGAGTELTLVNRTFIFTVVNYDLPSLFASKLHACFFRKYIKGRDFYDLIWYLGKQVKPNLVLLNNAVRQTHGIEHPVNDDNFVDFLSENLARVDFVAVKKDVQRFLEDKNELKLLDKDIILQVAKKPL